MFNSTWLGVALKVHLRSVERVALKTGRVNGFYGTVRSHKYGTIVIIGHVSYIC